jgi:choline kinase
MLEVGGKTLLERMVKILRASGCDDIVVIRGHLKEMIGIPDIKYYENLEYERNNILKSLFYAEPEMDGGFLVTYSDIVYERWVVEKLLEAEGEICVVTDTDWMANYQGRTEHPFGEAELVTARSGEVVKIGKNSVPPDEAHGEFIGLARFDRRGAEVLRARYAWAVARHRTGAFERASSLEMAYLTDLFQSLVRAGQPVRTVDIQGGWMEIDTPQDLARAQKRFSKDVSGV